jgi:hypothetical protein
MEKDMSKNATMVLKNKITEAQHALIALEGKLFMIEKRRNNRIAAKDADLIKKMPANPEKMTRGQVKWLLRPAKDQDPRLSENVLLEHRRFQVNYLESMGLGNLGSIMDSDKHVGIILGSKVMKKNLARCEKYLKMFLSVYNNDIISYEFHHSKKGLLVLVPCYNSIMGAIITKKGPVDFYKDGRKEPTTLPSIKAFLKYIS